MELLCRSSIHPLGLGGRQKVANLLKNETGLFYLINLPPFLICEF